MSAPGKKNRGWLWYFALLLVLSIAATAILVVYNNRQQLRPEQLEAAHQLWLERGPANYHLVYTVNYTSVNGAHSDHYVVRVKKGKAREVFVNGLPQAEEKLGEYGMDKLFDYVERFQGMDAEKGRPRVFARAVFDPGTGGLRWYVRRVMGTRDRQEISVERFEVQ